MNKIESAAKEFLSHQVGPSLACRLLPGQDLKLALLNLVKVHNISAAVVLSSVGSLKEANLRMAGEKLNTFLRGPFEIVSLNGTLGAGGVHLHLGLSDAKGLMLGGHLVEGCEVNTTCEIVLLQFSDLIFRRTLDPQTGFQELDVQPGNFSRR